MFNIVKKIFFNVYFLVTSAIIISFTSFGIICPYLISDDSYLSLFFGAIIVVVTIFKEFIQNYIIHNDLSGLNMDKLFIKIFNIDKCYECIEIYIKEHGSKITEMANDMMNNIVKNA